jgi:hypothetical protein
MNVTIRFADGKLDVREAGRGGKALAVKRATVYLVEGNDAPVALIEVADARHEARVVSFDVPSVDGVLADPDVVEEGKPKK